MRGLQLVKLDRQIRWGRARGAAATESGSGVKGERLKCAGGGPDGEGARVARREIDRGDAPTLRGRGITSAPDEPGRGIGTKGDGKAVESLEEAKAKGLEVSFLARPRGEESRGVVRQRNGGPDLALRRREESVYYFAELELAVLLDIDAKGQPAGEGKYDPIAGMGDIEL